MNNHCIVNRTNTLYFCAVCIGFVIDISVSLTVRWFFSVSLPWAMVPGFLTGSLVNYVLFEFVVFKGRAPHFSIKRLAQTAGSASLAIAVRAIILVLLGYITLSGLIFDAAKLGVASCVSFLVQYLMVSWIFAANSSERRENHIGDLE